jgi:hypothetical protein
MTTFSIDAIWEDMVAFLRRETALLLPLSMATFGIAALLLTLAVDPQPRTEAAMPQPGLRTLWALPGFLLIIFGNVSISMVVLRPGATVGESLRLALTRMPSALGIIGLGVVAIFLAAMIATIIALSTGMGVGGSGMSLIFALLFTPGLWLTVRLLVMWPALADMGRGPIASLRASFALTRGHALKALAITVIFYMVYLTLTSIAQLVLSSLFQLIAIATGNAELLRLIASIIVAFIGSVLMMGWTVYLAVAYQRLRI